MDISQLIKPNIKNMEYIDWGTNTPKDAIRLQYGENAQIFPPARQAMLAEVENLNRYPDADKQEEYELLAQYTDTDPDMIAIGNSGDDILDLIARTFLGRGDRAVQPIPTYPCYISDTQAAGAQMDMFSLRDDFSLDVDKLVQNIRPETKVIWIANPNNPTGNLLLRNEDIPRIMEKYQGILVLDEAYYEMSDYTGIDLIQQYPNIVVARTFAKAYGLAGISFGYMVADPLIIRAIRCLQDGPQVFAVNRCARAAAIAILQNLEEAIKFVTRFKSRKQGFEQNVSGISGVRVMPTLTSFSLLRLENMDSDDFKGQLQSRNIYVKDLSIYKGIGSDLVYMAIPSEQEQADVINSVNEILGG